MKNSCDSINVPRTYILPKNYCILAKELYKQLKN